MDWKPGNNIPGATNDFDITKISDTISQWLIHRGHMGAYLISNINTILYKIKIL